MKKTILIILFSSFFSVVFLMLSFVMARVFYNIDNGILFYNVDLLSFFLNFDIKDLEFFLLIFLINFTMVYLRYRGY